MPRSASSAKRAMPTAPPSCSPVSLIPEAWLHTPSLRLCRDQSPELQVGEVLRRHESSRCEESFGGLTGGDSHGRDTGGDGGRNARDRVLEGKGLFGRDPGLPKCGLVGGGVRLYCLHLVGEHDR